MIDDFLEIDADVPAVDAARMVEEATASHIVVCDLRGTRGVYDEDDEDEDDDDYYVFGATDVTAALRDVEGMAVGDALGIVAIEPSPVVGRGAVGEITGGGSGPIVVIEQGAVAGLAGVDAAPGAGAPPRRSRGWAMAEPPAPMAASAGDDMPAAAAGADPSASGVPMAVAVEYPTSVAVTKTMSLLVRLTFDLSQPQSIPFTAETGDVIDIHVSPGDGLVCEGDPDVQLSVTGDAEPLPVQFKLRATAVGTGHATVYAFRRGQPLGAITISPEIVAAGAADTTPVEASAPVEESSAGARADLELLIFEHRNDAGQVVLEYRLTSRDPALELNMEKYRSEPLNERPDAFIAALYKDIIELPLDTPKLRELAARRVEKLGSHLFGRLFPEDLRALLWKLKDRVGTVLIQSEEPWIPWEICRLEGEVDGRVVEGEFFCEAFELTRWIPEVRRTPTLTASKVGVICPPSDLASAEAERTMMKGLAAAGRVVEDIEARIDEVEEALASGTFDVVHFTGHGAFPDATVPDTAEISLTGSQRLRPTDITGAVKNLRIKSPIVFFNACQAGRLAPALTGVGGWADAMLRAGAGAFVSSHWDVTDDLALTFATTLYERLLAGDTFGAAVRTARLSIRDGGDPTWLAYTAFADLGAVVA